MRVDLHEISCRQDLEPFYQTRLVGIAQGHDQFSACLLAGVCNRQYTAYRSQISRQGEFGAEFILAEHLGWQLLVRGYDSERDREIVLPSFLREVGRGQIDNDLAQRIFEMIDEDCAPHAILAFSDRKLWETYDGESRQPSGDMDLNG